MRSIGERRNIILKKWFISGATGIFSGFLNGLFGSGGGMVAVPMLKKSGLSVKEAHATSLMMMAALSVLSTALYISEGRLSFSDGGKFIPGGILGSLFGSLIFKKLPSGIIKKLFGGFVIFSALRMLLMAPQ